MAYSVTSYAAFIDEAAQRFELPASWIGAVLRAESGGDPRAVSPAGAMGLMQIMPATWDELRVHHGLGANPFDPRDNILAGAAYLRQLHDRYGSIRAMLAAYNAGRRAMRRRLPASRCRRDAHLHRGLGADHRHRVCSRRHRIGAANGAKLA